MVAEFVLYYPFKQQKWRVDTNYILEMEGSPY